MPVRTLVILIAFIAFAVAGPYIINEAYKLNRGYITIWGAPELLVYYGAVLSGSATIFAVLATIHSTRKAQLEERKFAVKPWLTSTLEPVNFKEQIVHLKQVNTIYVSREDGLWTTSKTMPPGLINGEQTIAQSVYIIAYEVSNVGGDTAIEVETSINDMPILPKHAIAKDRNENLTIILPLSEAASCYTIRFKYKDVMYANSYVQSESFSVFRSSDNYVLIQDRGISLTPPEVL